MSDTDTTTLDPKDLFIACEAELRSLVPLFQSWRSGNRRIGEIIEPVSAHLKVIASKAGDLRPSIATEGDREKWIAAALVYAAGLVTGREDLIPFIDDERAARWLIRLISSAAEYWRAKREAQSEPAAA